MKQCRLLVPKWIPFFFETAEKRQWATFVLRGVKAPGMNPRNLKTCQHILKCIPSTRQGWTRRNYTSLPREPCFRTLQSWELLQSTFHPEHYTQFLVCRSDFTVFWIDIIPFANIITWWSEKLFSQYKNILMSAFRDMGEILWKGELERVIGEKEKILLKAKVIRRYKNFNVGECVSGERLVIGKRR